MLFSMLSRQYLGLKKNQNENYINHILCLLQPFFISKCLARMPFWHLRKPGIQSCENVPGTPRPSASTFYTSTERLTHLKVLKCTFISTQTFEADLSQLFFVGSFPYFKFLSTKINSEVRRKQPAKDWPVAGCFGRLPALIDSTVAVIVKEKELYLWKKDTTYLSCG